MTETYSVFNVSQMLNVNEETIRRWIRDDTLPAKRAVGRSGHSIRLADIVSFANKPPRAYLLSLEVWLTANNIPFERIEDPPKHTPSERTKILASLTTGSAASAIVSTAIPATLATGPAGLIAGAVALGTAGVAYGTTKIVRKLYQTHTIRLLAVDEITQQPNETSARLDNEVKVDITQTASSANIVSSEGKGSFTALANILQEITQAKQLLDAGIITADEFAEIKAKLIAKI